MCAFWGTKKGMWGFYDKKYHQWYIRTIEANNPCGVKRGCLTKERFKESGGGAIIRVKVVSQEEINTAVQFCDDQLNKGYELNVFRYPHITGDKWYCSELAWAHIIMQQTKELVLIHFGMEEIW